MVYNVFFINMLFSVLFKYKILLNIASFIIALIASTWYLSPDVLSIIFLLTNYLVTQVCMRQRMLLHWLCRAAALGSHEPARAPCQPCQPLTDMFEMQKVDGASATLWFL
jgi:hypothetical protein